MATMIHQKVSFTAQPATLFNIYLDSKEHAAAIDDKTPAYDLAVTHKKELTAIFKRLWKFKDDQPQRDLHLDLLSVELKELRDTLQTIK